MFTETEQGFDLDSLPFRAPSNPRFILFLRSGVWSQLINSEAPNKKKTKTREHLTTILMTLSHGFLFVLGLILRFYLLLLKPFMAPEILSERLSEMVRTKMVPTSHLKTF